MPFENEYSLPDKILHYIAFTLPAMQKILCNLEDDIYRKELNSCKSENEVFVTGLPRSGTTMILEMLYNTGEFSTYTYRSMPFILSPILWDKISHYFQKTGTSKERAHGDGMEVSFDSPEAFEEIIWMSYMKKYIVKDDSLRTISSSDCPDIFIETFKRSLKKLIFLHHNKGNDQNTRYLSKNNANISRLDAINKIFPSAIVVVPFRNPIAHVSSLFKQHRNFCEMHVQDSFSRHYMKWLGHYDFGHNFKPINFYNWIYNKQSRDDKDINYWLEYWINTYRYILKHLNKNIILIDYDQLLMDGEVYIEKIADSVGIKNKKSMISSASKLHASTKYNTSQTDFDKDLFSLAQEIHLKLVDQSI